MSLPLQLLILSDGKPGHHNQSLGLADALSRITETNQRTIDLSKFPRSKKILRSLHAAREGPPPDWILAAGHRTHTCALLLSRILQARSIILMKPSWPIACFDACLIPSHDLIGKSISPRVIPTTGALNRMIPSGEKQSTGLILIGGDSRDFLCDASALRKAVEQVVRSSDLSWHITDSRRSPEGFLASLGDLPVTLHPHQETGPDWLPQQLGKSHTAWVTCESVSMIYESLSSGAQVGLLPMTPRKSSSKIQHAIAQLQRDGFITTLTEYRETGLMKRTAPLAEADRCARILLEKLPCKHL